MIEPSIELNFVSFNNKLNTVTGYKLSFQRTIQNIGDLTYIRIPISDDVFKYNKYKNSIELTLFDKDSKIINKMRINVYNGENFAYIVRGGKGTCAEIIFRNMKEIEIEKDQFFFHKLDTMNTVDRKRLTLINYDFSNIKINKETYSIEEIIHSNCGLNASSFQISVFSLSQKIYAVKPIFDSEPNIAFDNLKALKDLIKNKVNEFVKILKIEDISEYKQSVNTLKGNIGIAKDILTSFMKMNLPKDYLEEVFEKNKWINLEIYYNILILNSLFLLTDEQLNERTLITKFLELIKKIIIDLDSNNNLKIYQKIQIIINIFMCIHYIDDENDLPNLNIRYYTFSDAEENSILFKIKKFFDELIPQISEESIVFKNLLYLNSGHGYNKFNPVYCFDMKNVDMIRKHIKSIFPESLIFFNSLKKNTLAFHHSPGGGIAINEYKVVYQNFQIKDLNYNKICQIDNVDDIAMNLVLLLFHEYLGHKKYNSGFVKDYDKVSSPRNYINELNELIELKYYKDYNAEEKNCDFILSSNNQKKGDSGHFLELSYGKIQGKLVFSYLNNFNDNRKLLKRPDLFSDKTGEKLKKYVELKYNCKKKNISLSITSNMSIEDEIKEMEEAINLKTFKRLKEKETDNELTLLNQNKKKKADNELQTLTEEDSKDEDNKEGTIDESEIANKKDSIESEEKSYKSKKERNRMDKLQEIEERVAKKFKFKLDETMVRQVYDKLDDPNLSFEDKCDLAYLTLRYSIQE